jgi:hypothetical protein
MERVTPAAAMGQVIMVQELMVHRILVTARQELDSTLPLQIATTFRELAVGAVMELLGAQDFPWFRGGLEEVVSELLILRPRCTVAVEVQEPLVGIREAKEAELFTLKPIT